MLTNSSKNTHVVIVFPVIREELQKRKTMYARAINTWHPQPPADILEEYNEICKLLESIK